MSVMSVSLIPQFLTILLGIALALLCRGIFSYTNTQLLKEIIKNKMPDSTPFILSIITMFALIEYWRITNISIVEATTKLPPYFLYIDLSLFVFAFIALDGYSSSIIYCNDQNKIKDFANSLGSSTIFLGVFLCIGLARYFLTIFTSNIYFNTFSVQIFAHIAGILLCIWAHFIFKKRYMMFGFVLSWTGLIIIIIYLVTLTKTGANT